MTDEPTPKLQFERLTRSNWDAWIEHVHDYLDSVDTGAAPDMWTTFVWRPPPAQQGQPQQQGGDEDAGDADPAEDAGDADPAEHDYQQANNAANRAVRLSHTTTSSSSSLPSR